MSECPVRLHRDALNTQWGFRLQGGKDFNTPLTVQRVFVGSPADGELHRGDIILAIENYDVSAMTHKHAQDIIKKAGGSISLRIRRSAKGFGVDYSRPHGAGQQFHATPGHNYGSPGGGQSMLNRVNQTLSEVVWQPQNQNQYGGYPQDHHQGSRGGYQQDHHQVHSAEEDDHTEPHRSVRELVGTYTPPRPTTKGYRPPARRPQPPQQQHFNTVPRASTGGGSKVHRGWSKPAPDPIAAPSGLTEPGWTPKARPVGMAPNAMSHGRSTAPAPTQYSSYTPPPPQPAHHHQDQNQNRPPAWAGTLRHSGAPRPWEIQEGQMIVGGMPEHEPACQRQMSGGHVPAPTGPAETVVPHQPKVQNVHYGPGGAPTYEQHNPDAHHSDTAQVTHAQYNTPIGLYSPENVQAALDSQTTGKPGQGTLQVTTTGPGKKPFNPAQSDVYRLLMEEESRKKPPRGHGLRPEQQQQYSPQQSARYEDQGSSGEMHYHGYQDHTMQSRSMHNLEQNMAHDQECGASDF